MNSVLFSIVEREQDERRQNGSGRRQEWRRSKRSGNRFLGPGRQQHAAHEPLIGSEIVAKVRLAGLSFMLPSRSAFAVPRRKVRIIDACVFHHGLRFGNKIWILHSEVLGFSSVGFQIVDLNRLRRSVANSLPITPAKRLRAVPNRNTAASAPLLP